MKFYIETFGCKVNAYESNFIKQSLENNGFLYVSNDTDADIIIINTCTVTNTASSKCKKYLRKILRNNSNVLIIATGCDVQNNFEEYKNLGVPIIVGNNYKSKIFALLNDYLDTKTSVCLVNKTRDLEFEGMLLDNFSQTRGYIKIQDGCDNFCSYCIIPFVRGKCRSKNFDVIIEETNALVKKGHQEIVLTGINTGSYMDEGKDLVDLINEISKIDGLERIRLSSVEITELNEKFLLMLKNNSKFCDHLHIPLQSGSDDVLKLMNRKYNLEYFANKIEMIRKIRPNIAITTDVIVGFPGETDEMFQKAYEFASEIAFSKIHVFPYSRRNGTKASLMKEVNSQVKTNRVHQLLNLSAFLEQDYQRKFDGEEVEVLIEEKKDGIFKGYTSNYLKVELQGDYSCNKIYKVKYQDKEKIVN